MSNRIQSTREHRKWPAATRKAASTWQRMNGSAASAQAKYERYVGLAKEAASRGDRVEAENCYQHAEHFFRVMQEQE